MQTKDLKAKARQIRATCLQMAVDAKIGHLSSTLSTVEILVALFYSWLKIFPHDPRNPDRDRFILSKGHGCASLYAVMADCGYFPREELLGYNQEKSLLPNHPCIHALSSLETSAGSLGHGLGIATGMAYGLRLNGNTTTRIVTLLGDGECNEGSIWESAMFAAAHKLDRVLAIVDYNGIQAVGKTDEISGHTSLEQKFRAFGWESETLDGTDIDVIQKALLRFPSKSGKPTALIAKTKLGLSFMDNDVLWHYRVPSPEELKKGLSELGVAPLVRKDTKI